MFIISYLSGPAFNWRKDRGKCVRGYSCACISVEFFVFAAFISLTLKRLRMGICDIFLSIRNPYLSHRDNFYRHCMFLRTGSGYFPKTKFTGLSVSWECSAYSVT